MNSKIISAIVACVLFCVWTPHLLAMGGDYQVDTNGNIISQQPDWPSGLAELINSGPVFHGHWVNPNDEFFFLGDTGSLTRFLTRYSSLTNTPLVVVLHAGSERRSELGGDKPTERYDWKVIVMKRGRGAPEKPESPQEKWVVTVDVWIDHDIRLADLVVPKNVQVKSAGEIEAFIRKTEFGSIADFHGLSLADAPRNTKPADLADLMEAVPPGSVSYEMRKNVVVVYVGFDGTVYKIPEKNIFYVRHDLPGSSTRTYYGPFAGDPAKVLNVEMNRLVK